MLPMTEIPCANLELPGSGKVVKVRAITTKEEKVLLIAKEAGEKTDIDTALKSVINECTYNKLEITKMAPVDLIAIFLKIVEMSKGTVVTHEYICKNMIKNDKGEEVQCNTTIRVPIDLNEVVYTKAKNQKGLIDISESIKVQMHPVAIEDMTDAMKKAKNNIEFAYWQAANCMDAVISGEDYQNEFTKQEAYDWIMSMPSTMSAKLIEYINDVPTAKLSHTIRCPNCDNTQEIVLTGLSDFFPNGLLAIL